MIRTLAFVVFIIVFCNCLYVEQLLGPESPSDREVWFANITDWREQQLSSINYNGSLYEIPELFWTQTALIQPQMMVHERYFYDPVTKVYTIDKYLSDLKRRYGGINAVLVWQSYPNMGIDNRNQFDLIRALPGGIETVKKFVAQFKNSGVRVLFPYNPWDQGTRYVGKPDDQALAELWSEIGADGFNGDTMCGIPENFFQTSIDIGYPLALEPECRAPIQNLDWTPLGWGYWDYPFVPSVDMYKWLESRRLTNVCDRWATNKTNDLQYAFFNGAGYESWENVWGIWNGIAPRYEEALRRVSSIMNTFSPLLRSKNWVPHVPTLQNEIIFSSMFPLENQTLWNLVNRANVNTTGAQIEIPYLPSYLYFDIYNGVQFQVGKNAKINGNTIILYFDIEALGFGAVYAAEKAVVDDNFYSFLDYMNEISVNSLESYSDEWIPLQQTMIINKDNVNVFSSTPKGMTFIPGNDNWLFEVQGVEIEGDPLPEGVDVQYPWEQHPSRNHSHYISIDSYYIDTFPVTNSDFQQFLQLSNYNPADSYNFLKDWSNGNFPQGWGNKPVTWVSLLDAKAFCEFNGKRLPDEWEWQYAAQGNTSYLYPWGNKFESSNVPVVDNGRTLRGPDDVNAHPDGASPFGVMDMVGNVWQWTNEFVDEHTRAAVLRGSSYYYPSGSMWYFPQAYELNKHGKYLLMDESYDRAGTLGFRCAASAIN